MEISLLVAKVLGVYLVVSGCFIIFKGKTLPHLLQDFFDHPAIVYLTGVILIFLSSLFLVGHNVWDGSWRTAVTILMWATLFKGVAYIFFPEVLHRMATKRILNSLSLYGLIAIIAGVYLFRLG